MYWCRASWLIQCNVCMRVDRVSCGHCEGPVNISELTAKPSFRGERKVDTYKTSEIDHTLQSPCRERMIYMTFSSYLLPRVAHEQRGRHEIGVSGWTPAVVTYIF